MMEEVYENYGSKMDDALRKMSALESLALGKKLSEEDTKTIKEFKCVKEFLDSPNNSKIENDLKKVFVQAIVAGMQSGTLPFQIPEDASAESIACVIDEGLTRLKVAYQLENGVLEDEYEAEEIIIEHKAVRTATLTEMAVEKGIELANQVIDNLENKSHSYADYLLDNVDTMLTMVESAYPQITPVVEFCKVVVSNYMPEIKEYVHRGITQIATVAKSYAKTIIEQAPVLLKKAVKLLT
jgi:hypothetical protein